MKHVCFWETLLISLSREKYIPMHIYLYSISLALAVCFVYLAIFNMYTYSTKLSLSHITAIPMILSAMILSAFQRHYINIVIDEIL